MASNALADSHFDHLADLYERFVEVMNTEHNPVRVWLRQQLRGGNRVLDLGCGGGQNCLWLAQRYREVQGVDVSARMIAIAEAKSHPQNIRFEHRNALDMCSATDGHFDAVLAVNTIFHLGETEQALSRLRHLVATGGKLVVVDVVLPSRFSAAGDSVRDSRYVFEVAHSVYRMSGDVEAAINSVRLMLHPVWRQMSETRSPLTRAEFRRRYSASLPGARITTDIVPDLAMAVWDRL